jgi:hypothetical protein
MAVEAAVAEAVVEAAVAEAVVEAAVAAAPAMRLVRNRSSFTRPRAHLPLPRSST